MNQSPPDILSSEWGWDNFRRDVFQLVAWGYQLVETEVRQRHQEEDITGLLRRGIREKLDEELPPRFRFYFPANEDPVDDDGAFGKKRRRVDILIECSGSRPRVRYRLEAKRCARNENAIGTYTEGVLAFVQRRYARDSPEAGLLGLVQSDTAEHWRMQLSLKLGEDESLRCQSLFTHIDLTPNLLPVSVSLHQRDDGSLISLYHAFLDCNQP
jgi:hypothetical protein